MRYPSARGFPFRRRPPGHSDRASTGCNIRHRGPFSAAAKAEAPVVLRDDQTGSNAAGEAARKEAVNTARVTEHSGDEQLTRIEREIAVCKRFDVPPEKGLNREEASLAFSDNGINPRACGSWTQHGWIIREGDRRWLSDKGREWIRDQATATS